MVLHKCEICSYETKYTTNYKRHMESKKHLAKENLYLQQKQISESNVNQMSTKCQPNVNLCQPLPKKYFCSFCSKTFNTRQAKSKHQKNCCHNNEMSTKCQPNVNQCQPMSTIT